MFCLLYPSVCILLLFFVFVSPPPRHPPPLGIHLSSYSLVFCFLCFVSYFVCACVSFVCLFGFLWSFTICLGFCLFIWLVLIVVCLFLSLLFVLDFVCFHSTYIFPPHLLLSFLFLPLAEPCGLLGFNYDGRVGLNLCCVSSQCRILECQRISSPREY